MVNLFVQPKLWKVNADLISDIMENGYTKFAKKGTALWYELLALSRMTGEQIANELTDEEREEYYKIMHGE